MQVWRKLSGWWSRQWAAIRPGPEARRGADWGMLALAVCGIVIAGLYIRTGFGLPFDFAFATVAAALIIGVSVLAVALVLAIARRLPRWSTGFIVGCGLVFFEVWNSPIGWPLAIVAGLAVGFLGATVATFLRGGFQQAALSKRIITSLLCVLALSASVYIVWLFAHDGSMEKTISWRPPLDAMPAKISAPNPTERGPYPVKLLFYGAGTDIRRPEYGSSVGIKTGTVDASDFFKEFKGWRRWARKEYWGFDFDKLPLNGRVWMPEGAGPFPLALIVHGNHNMADFSDPGYAYLGELLASRGFILVSVDENFLNSGLFNDPPKQQAVRGWMLLEHLKLWRAWNQTPGSRFQGKVDMHRIALLGHSRGGEAAATATAFNRIKYYPDDANIRFDYGFDITSVVAIAPADGQYKPAGQHRWIEDVNYLTLQGAQDADVSSFMGSRQWDHVRYTQPGEWFKAEIYAYRANHGQFNSGWGRHDVGLPGSWLLNLKPLIPPEQQRQISAVYIAAFLEATLRDRREYVPLFEDWRVARDWLPDTLYVNRYQSASYAALAGYQEDADITTTTAPGGHIAGENLSIWREGRIPWRRGDRDYNGVFLGWNRAKGAPAATYTLTLPEGSAETWRLGDGSTVELSVATLDEDAPLPGKKKDKDAPKKSEKKTRESPDFTIELITNDGAIAKATVSRFAAVPPPLKEKFTKVRFESQIYQKDWEPVFQTVRVPVSRFQKDGAKDFDARRVSQMRLIFDRTPSSVICVSGIGFGKQ
jgi:dienelactone hydrolase